METKAAGSTLYFGINTHKADGTPITWAGSPSVAVTKDGGTTTETDGVSLSVDAGGVTGRHVITIDTSQDGTFFATGHKFAVIVTAGTVDSVSTVGLIVAEFELGEVPANLKAWNGGALPVPAEAGDEMDLVDAPNSTAVSAIQSGLATPGDIPDISALVDSALAAYGAAKPADLANLDAAISSRLAAVDYVEPPTVEEIDAELTTNHGDGSWGPPAGSRANTYTVYESDGITPMAGCEVWATSDDAGAHEISNRGLTTDAGKHVFYFDLAAGTTVYIWRRKSGKSFTNPDAEVVA